MTRRRFSIHVILRGCPGTAARVGLLAVWLAVVGETLPAAGRADEAEHYQGPCVLAAAKDGSTLYVASADSHEVAWVELAGGKVTRRVAVPGEPTGLALSPDGTKLIVTCAAPKSTVAVLDAASGSLIASIPAGHTAMSPVVSPDGARLYVCNRFDNDVSVIDLTGGKEVARVPAVREPIAADITPDGRELLVANHLPLARTDRTFFGEVVPIVTVIDTRTLETAAIPLRHGANGLRGLCVSPDGKHAFVTHLLSNFEMIPFRVDTGWINVNVVSVLDVAERKVESTIGLDEYDLGAGNPWDVTCSADGQTVCVSLAGTHELLVIGREELLGEFAHRTMQPMMAVWPIYLSLGDSLWRRIKLPGKGPRGLAAAGSKVYAAQYFSDSVAVVDLSTAGLTVQQQGGTGSSPQEGATGSSPARARTALADKPPVAPVRLSSSDSRADSYGTAGRAYSGIPFPPPGEIPVGPAQRLTERRRGELLFHDATVCYQQWQSCASCHPDGRADGLNWDLMNDGTGNSKNTKSLLLSHQTPPAMAAGVRESAEKAVRSGLANILFADLPEADAAAIDTYLRSLRPVPSPHLVEGRLSPAAERGRQLFHAERVACDRCHPAPLYTDMRSHNVGSRTRAEARACYDTPTLVEVWRTAPYLHDGRYTTVKELLVEGRHGLKHHGDELTEQEIDDLAEFVLSL